MKAKAILAAGGLALIAATAWASSNDNDASQPISGDVLPLESVLPRVGAQYPGRVTEAGLENEDGKAVYEIELLTNEGRKLELIVDARTGKVLNSKRDD